MRALFGLLLLLLLSPFASATVLRAMPVEELALSADLVAVVRVGAIETVRAKGRLTRHVSVEVETVFKGPPGGEAPVVLVPGGEAGDWVQRVPGAPEPESGTRVLVFLQRNAGGYFRPVGLSQGWLVVEEDSVVRTPGGSFVAPGAGGALVPAAPPPSREPLAPLLERVRRAVAR